MQRHVTVCRVAGVDLIAIENPPVNAINSEIRAALAAHVAALRDDESVLGAVLTGAGRMFSGGGDLREIGKPEPEGAPSMRTLADAIEQSPKPIICALRGETIGGGLLLAMACHGRVAAQDLRAALPEVLLGFVPGSGGTQRLPRLVGLEAALDLIVLAQRADAEAAFRLGLVDAIDEAPVETAASWVRQGRLRRTRELPAPAPAPHLAELYRAKAEAAFPGRAAPLQAIELVLGASEWLFDDGVERAQRLSRAMMKTDEARRLVAKLLERRREAG